MVYPEDINVVFMDNPHGIKGSVNKNRDGSYTIIINAALNREQQLEVFKHELRHIEDMDFYKDCSADEIESQAHSLQESTPVAEQVSLQDKYPIAYRYFDSRKKNRRQKQLQERLDFIAKHYDTFKLAEQQYLYGND